MKRIGFFLLFLMMLTFELSGQQMSLSNIRLSKLRSSGTIVENNVLKGYYYFYLKQHDNAKTDIYTVTLFDINLNKELTFDIRKPRNIKLLEVVYNTSSYMLIFINKRQVEYETYDNTGKKTGSNIVEKVTDLKTENIRQALRNPKVDNVTTFPVGNSGFVRSNWEKKKKQGFDIEAMDNNAHRRWIYQSNPESGLLELGDIKEVNKKYVAVTVMKKKSRFDRFYNTNFLLFDAETGKKLFELSMKDENEGELSLLNCFTDEDNGQVTLVGEFYMPGDKVLKDKSMGLFIKIVDTAGKEVKYQKYRWDKEILQLRKPSVDDEQDKTSLCFQHFVRSGHGHLYAVAEEYCKTLSFVGVAANFFTSSYEITITDMVLIEFDETMKMIAYTKIPKKKTHCLLPELIGWNSPSYLAEVVKTYGAFDYCFTSANKTNDQYQIIYTDFDREKADGSRADKMIGIITINENNTTNTKMPIDTDAVIYSINPAKTGYLMVSEYFRNKKILSVHLEKMAD